MAELVTIDLDAERLARDRLLTEWRKAKAAMDAAVIMASRTHASPGNNYWVAEAKARARWISAANVVEALEEAAHANAVEGAERRHARGEGG